jgi:hypothetical protein
LAINDPPDPNPILFLCKWQNLFLGKTSGEPLAYFSGVTADLGAGPETAMPQARFLSVMKLMLKARKQFTIGPCAQRINRLHAWVFR